MFLSLKSFYIFKLYVSLSSIGYLIYQLIQYQSSAVNSLEVNPVHPSGSHGAFILLTIHRRSSSFASVHANTEIGLWTLKRVLTY